MAKLRTKNQVNIEIDDDLAELLDAAADEFGGVGGDFVRSRAAIARAVLKASLPGWIEVRRQMRVEERARMTQVLSESMGKASAEPPAIIEQVLPRQRRK